MQFLLLTHFAFDIFRPQILASHIPKSFATLGRRGEGRREGSPASRTARRPELRDQADAPPSTGHAGWPLDKGRAGRYRFISGSGGPLFRTQRPIRHPPPFSHAIGEIWQPYSAASLLLLLSLFCTALQEAEDRQGRIGSPAPQGKGKIAFPAASQPSFGPRKRIELERRGPWRSPGPQVTSWSSADT